MIIDLKPICLLKPLKFQRLFLFIIKEKYMTEEQVSPLYKTMKIFDFQNMNEDVQNAFLKDCRESQNCDRYVEWIIGNSIGDAIDEDDFDPNADWLLNRKIVDAWLIENGAQAAKDDRSEGDTVLIER